MYLIITAYYNLAINLLSKCISDCLSSGSFIGEIIQTIGDVPACVSLLSLTSREDYYGMSNKIVKLINGIVNR